MNQVKVLKLVSGEDIVGKVATIDEHSMKVEGAARIVMVQDNTGQPRLALIPFIPASEISDYVIKSIHVICDVEASEDLYNAWNQEYGSGLVVASTGGLSLKLTD